MYQLKRGQRWFTGLQNPRNTVDVSPGSQVEAMSILGATCQDRTYFWWYNNQIGRKGSNGMVDDLVYYGGTVYGVPNIRS